MLNNRHQLRTMELMQADWVNQLHVIRLMSTLKLLVTVVVILSTLKIFSRLGLPLHIFSNTRYALDYKHFALEEVGVCTLGWWPRSMRENSASENERVERLWKEDVIASGSCGRSQTDKNLMLKAMIVLKGGRRFFYSEKCDAGRLNWRKSDRVLGKSENESGGWLNREQLAIQETLHLKPRLTTHATGTRRMKNYS